MRNLDLSHPVPHSSDPLRTARLTGHLKARLLDFGPGGPEVPDFDPAAGTVSARFPGKDTAQVLALLEQAGISAGQEGDRAVFYLRPDTRFEDLDYLWGCLFNIL